ncbi:unnamed protein product [Mycena citricolor]|uniref:Protein kinase domain-containing protein n=1 Tax=Mycena citricolor TaxID=2018698 RepID=A0AAD2GUY2_9AGAR|nr:unnamed protein product [Mycena citricolor]
MAYHADREHYWKCHYSFLLSCGYALRPRLAPDYVKPTQIPERDDSDERHPRPEIMDAERIRDGKQVILKSVLRSVHYTEVEIGTLFSSSPLAGDPRNHCIPILEVLHDPEDSNIDIIVMPRMVPAFRYVEFETVGEVVDCLRQILEGVKFMHENFVAHRDCVHLNFVVDPAKLFPKGNHPVRPLWDLKYEHLATYVSRASCWPRYYIIDFGWSERYNPKSGLLFEPVVFGGDRSPPEHNTTLPPTPCNPFPTDVYTIGNLMQRRFLLSDLGGGSHPPLRFLQPLVDEMMRDEPSARPTIGEALAQFNFLCARLTSSQLRAPGALFRYPLSTCMHPIRKFVNTIAFVRPLPRDLHALYAKIRRSGLGPPTDPWPVKGKLRDFYTKSRWS